MKSRPKRVLAVLLVVAVAISMAAGGSMAATPSIDSETTNTAYQSDIVSETTLSGFNGSESNESRVTVEIANDSTPEFEITRNGSDTVVGTNTSMTNVTVGSWGSTWNGTISHDALHDTERGIDDNVSMDLTSHDGNESNSTTVQFYINTTDEFTVQNIDDVDADPDTDDAPVETESVSDGLTTISTFDIHTLEFSDLDIEDRAVSGDETDLVVVFSNGTVQDDAEAAIPDDVADQDPMYRMTLVVSADDGPTQPIRVYHEEAPDSVDEDEDTYAIYHDGGIGGEDGVVVNLGEEYEDAEEVSLTGTLNDGWADAAWHQAATSPWNPLQLAGFLGGISDLVTGAVPPVALVGASVRRRGNAA